MGFKNFYERGLWVELVFMAAALSHGYRVLKPLGEAAPYDIGIELPDGLLRVQVKSTTFRQGAGYLCEFTHSRGGKNRRYCSGQLDLCVAYVIPEKVWYIIPAHRITGPRGNAAITLSQFEGCRIPPKYETYREAWHLLTKSREELLRL